MAGLQNSVAHPKELELHAVGVGDLERVVVDLCVRTCEHSDHLEGPNEGRGADACAG